MTVSSRIQSVAGVEGALLSVGDTHAAQGDGEVCGTAVESDGRGPDLREAAQDAVGAMISYLGDRHGIDPAEAYALVSVAFDLRIHELVDAPNWVVAAFLPRG